MESSWLLTMKEIISVLIMPLPVLFLAIISGCVLLWRRRRRAARILFILSGFWLLIISTRPLPYSLTKNLENKYIPLLSDSLNFSGNVNIYVLAAGHSDDERLPSNGQVSGTGLARISEAVRLSGKIPSAKIILSGPGGKGDLNQAEVLRKTILMMGIDSSKIEMIKTGVNTRAEAGEYMKRFGTEKRLILVTSALHMPRAVIWFRKYNLDPIPAPADYLIKHGSRISKYRWLPSSKYLQMMEASVHEYAGLMVAKLQGRKDLKAGEISK